MWVEPALFHGTPITFVSRKLHRIWAETVETATDLGYGTFIVWVELDLFFGTPQCLLLAQKQTILAYIPRQCTTTTSVSHLYLKLRSWRRQYKLKSKINKMSVVHHRPTPHDKMFSFPRNNLNFGPNKMAHDHPYS